MLLWNAPHIPHTFLPWQHQRQQSIICAANSKMWFRRTPTLSWSKSTSKCVVMCCVRVGFDLLSLKSVGSFLFGPITEMLWPERHPIASHRIACNYNVYTNYVLSAPSCFTLVSTGNRCRYIIKIKSLPPILTALLIVESSWVCVFCVLFKAQDCQKLKRSELQKFLWDNWWKSKGKFNSIEGQKIRFANSPIKSINKFELATPAVNEINTWNTYSLYIPIRIFFLCQREILCGHLKLFICPAYTYI